MKIAPEPMSAPDIYSLLTGIVVPRPIAWVTTLSVDGIVNLAPFSCFTFVSSKPPMIGINIGLRQGERKDTARNIEATGDFTVNIGDETMSKFIVVLSPMLPRSARPISLGLTPRQANGSKTPRLASAPIALECRLHNTIAFGEVGSQFTVGEVLLFHIRDGLCAGNKIETAKLRPVCGSAVQIMLSWARSCPCSTSGMW